MAGIDKTYFKTYNQYKEVLDWCNSIGIVKNFYGHTFNPKEFLYDLKTKEEIESGLLEVKNKIGKRKNQDDYLYYVNLMEKSSDYTYEDYCEHLDSCVELPLWNTPYFFDVFLIRNCPIKFIKDRLIEQYGEEEVKRIKNGKSYYDVSKDTFKIKLTKDNNFKIRSKNLCYTFVVLISCECSYACYDEKTDSWVYNVDRDPYFREISYKRKGYTPIRSIIRKIKKWNLPVNSEVKIYVSYKDYESFLTYTGIIERNE